MRIETGSATFSAAMLVFAHVTGCGADDSGRGSHDAGGAGGSATGGVVELRAGGGMGGAALVPRGGSPSLGGGAPLGVGGSASGGAFSGGSAGGSSVGGGAPAGGGASVGGGTSVGGSASVAGSASVGGSASLGGWVGFGGSPASGGNSGWGGTADAGGSTSLGGNSPAGGWTGFGGGSFGGTTNAGGSGGSGGSAAGGAAECPLGPGCDPVLAGGLRIGKISAYQAVEVPLMEEWAEVQQRSVPIVQAKDLLLRVHVEVQPGWVTRSVRAALEVQSSAGTFDDEETKRVSEDSSQESLGSTFNLTVPAESLTGDARYSVSLYEEEVAPGGDSSRARWPETSTVPIDEDSTHGGLKIVVVPVQYTADGSGRMPDTSDAQLDLFRSYFARHYPVSDDDVSVVLGEPMPWNQPVLADGSGWEELLYELYTLRYDRGSLPEEYFYGAFSPAEGINDYCRHSCVTGLGFVGMTPGGGFFQSTVAIGLGFSGALAAETMIHEIGHNHGREHAPCGTNDADSSYPYPGGGIGSWGYDPSGPRLIDPERYYDFMGYCEPWWVSDYTYSALFDWIQRTNLSVSARGVPSTWMTVMLGSSGNARLGPRHELVLPPSGEPQEVELLDSALQVLATTTGYLTPFSHERGGGLLLVREPEAAAAYLQINGYTLVPL